jgi:hypothetical protein
MVGEEFRSAFSDFVPGSQVASYRIVEQIGRGGMAVVYRARDIRLDRWVALKILAPDLALDQVFRQRFIRESRAAAAVDHPNIIPIFEAGEADGVLFIAMRYVSGQDVRSLIDRVGALPAARAVGIVAQVAAALDAAHACGLVHRDVKPANMLLSDLAEGGTADHVYLSDFGVSKQSDSASSLTRTGQLVGTLDYLAPEQVEGRATDGRADVYALACAAFEMLCGTPPFKRDQSLAVLWAQLSAAPPALTSRRPDLPPAVDQVMARALAKSPADRYDKCAQFALSLQQACALRAGRPAADPTGTWAGPGGPLRDATEARPHGAGPGPLDAGTGPLDAGRGLTAGPARRSGTAHAPGPHRASFARNGLSGLSPEPPAPYRPAKRGSRSLLAVAAVCIALFVIAGGTVALLHDRSAPQPAPTAAARPAAGPATIVRMYFSAINRRDYARAWRLGGDNSGSTYSGFVRGFGTTERDGVTILSVSGNVVTARIAALQTNGTVKTYQGNYTVSHGAIVKFDIRQVS